MDGLISSSESVSNFDWDKDVYKMTARFKMVEHNVHENDNPICI